MGYLIKSNVINALEEDMGDTMMCYEGKREKDIIAFCYESMEQTIEKLPQYWPDNVVEDVGWIPVEERLPENNKLVLVWARSTARGANEWALGSCDNGFWALGSWGGSLIFPSRREVVAWHPLPEPYRRITEKYKRRDKEEIE